MTSSSAIGVIPVPMKMKSACSPRRLELRLNVALDELHAVSKSLC